MQFKDPPCISSPMLLQRTYQSKYARTRRALMTDSSMSTDSSQCSQEDTDPLLCYFGILDTASKATQTKKHKGSGKKKRIT